MRLVLRKRSLQHDAASTSRGIMQARGFFIPPLAGLSRGAIFRLAPRPEESLPRGCCEDLTPPIPWFTIRGRTVQSERA